MTDLDLDSIEGMLMPCSCIDRPAEHCPTCPTGVRDLLVAALREARADLADERGSHDVTQQQRDEARAEVERLTGALGTIAALPSASKPVRDIARDALLDVRHDPSATTDGGA